MPKRRPGEGKHTPVIRRYPQTRAVPVVLETNQCRCLGAGTRRQWATGWAVCRTCDGYAP